MPNFTLRAEHTDLYGNPTGNVVTHEFNAEYLPDVLENTELFLKGVGYVLSGTLDIVQDDFISDDFAVDPEFGDHGGGSTLEDYPELKEQV